MEDTMIDKLVMQTPTKIDKNSWQYDFALLEEIKALHDIPTDKFDSIMRKIMRKKSSCKLWFTNNPSTEWDGKRYRYCNYRCCPSSHRAQHFFCLVLERTENRINVVDGFLIGV